MTAALPTEDQIRVALKRVVDPEVGIDIVEMGLIYGIEIGDSIRITMTLTSPACPTGTLLMEEAQEAAQSVAPGAKVEVVCVWEPPWEPERMSDKAKKTLGW